jgi:hypothetical protein
MLMLSSFSSPLLFPSLPSVQIGIEFPQDDDHKSLLAQMETLCELRIFVPNDEREKELAEKAERVAEEKEQKQKEREEKEAAGEMVDEPEEEEDEGEEDDETAAQVSSNTQQAGAFALHLLPIFLRMHDRQFEELSSMFQKFTFYARFLPLPPSPSALPCCAHFFSSLLSPPSLSPLLLYLCSSPTCV